MEELTFLQPMNKGRHPEGAGLSESAYCIFCGPIQEPVTRQRIAGDESTLTLELTYGEGDLLGELRLRQVGTNLIIEESPAGLFRAYLVEKPAKYLGQVLMYALQFKIADLAELIERGVGDMKVLEDSLDNRIDNSGTYQILDFRRRYTDYGEQIIAVKEIIARIDKGYFPMQMQNSYVLQGQVALEFRFLEERFELVKNTVIQDLDTYTSIVNNNINRNTRLLSLVSLAAVALNFMFGGLLAVNPAIGVAGGIVIGGLTAGAAVVYRVGGDRSFPRIGQGGGRFASLLPGKPAASRPAYQELQAATTEAEEQEQSPDGSSPGA